MNDDQTAANSFEITAELAESAEAILEDFAHDAEVDVAVIVEESGALIAGISADDDVDVHTVAALVAGNIGATRALGKVVGETGAVETVNQGGDKITYLRELNLKFVLVGIADAGIPPGIIREKAAQISPDLVELLETGGISPKPVQIELGIADDELDEETADDEDDGGIFDLSDGGGDSVEVADSVGDDEGDEPAVDEEIKVAPVVIDSPFEFVSDDDPIGEESGEEVISGENESGREEDAQTVEVREDEEDIVEEEAGRSEAEDEGEAVAESIFELADSDGDSDDEEDGETEVPGDEEDDSDEVEISAPMLVNPAMMSEEEKQKKLEEDETTAVAAISTPISTDIAKKLSTEPEKNDDGDEEGLSTDLSEKKKVGKDDQTVNDTGEDDDDGGDDDDDEESIGGPRYVFEIG